MPNLFCFGLGYSAQHYIAGYGRRLDQIAGTVRDIARARDISHNGLAGRAIDVVAFDGTALVPDLTARLAATDFVLVSVPPDPDGDPVLRCYAEALARSPRLSAIVYLSTIGVYGDHGGGWVDENTEPNALSVRSRARLRAEREWTALAARMNRPVAVLRLAGIYGPGRNALVQVANSSARRVDKPGQVFNRIHVSDIAQAIEASFARHADGIFNIADDQPGPPGEPVLFAAGLLGVPPPPEVAFAEAAKSMSPLALSFYGENRRVRNGKMKRELGVELEYPTCREGLSALFAAGEAIDAAP